MSDTPSTESAPAPSRQPRPLRLPSPRASVVLATIMLGVGVALGAAIGPAPDPSFAGGAEGVAKRLPELIAALAARSAPSTPAVSTASSPVPAPSITPSTTAPGTRADLPSAPLTPTPAAAQPEPTGTTEAAPKAPAPSITNVWLIELAAGTLSELKAQPAAAPYITGQLLPTASVLPGWSALDASAFAAEAVLVHPPGVGATPPLLHSIVQPPCPEDTAGAACAPGTPGQLTAADEFLKATLAQITGTAAYREHGLVVVTFASVGIASQQELPAGASSATLTYQPPAGALLLSAFAKPGASPTPYDPTSPQQSVEKLLR
jgi:hypothetical protein